MISNKTLRNNIKRQGSNDQQMTEAGMYMYQPRPLRAQNTSLFLKMEKPPKEKLMYLKKIEKIIYQMLPSRLSPHAELKLTLKLN